MHVLQPKARRRLPKEVAQQTRLKQHRRRGKSFTDILDSIDKRLSSFDARLSLVEILHREFKSLRESLEFSQQQVETLAAENASLRDSVKSLTENMTHLSEDNKKIKETVIDLQARSMRDNLVFQASRNLPKRTQKLRLKTLSRHTWSFRKTPWETYASKSPSDGSEETWSPEAASYCGQIRILQAEKSRWRVAAGSWKEQTSA